MKKLTKKELEQQASEFGCSVEEIKELRKHILPFLGFAIDHLSLPLDSKKRKTCCLCVAAKLYGGEGSLITKYLHYRIEKAKPKDAGDKVFWWYDIAERVSIEGQQKRIEWCKLQRKIFRQ